MDPYAAYNANAYSAPTAPQPPPPHIFPGYTAPVFQQQPPQQPYQTHPAPVPPQHYPAATPQPHPPRQPAWRQGRTPSPAASHISTNITDTIWLNEDLGKTRVCAYQDAKHGSGPTGDLAFKITIDSAHLPKTHAHIVRIQQALAESVREETGKKRAARDGSDEGRKDAVRERDGGQTLFREPGCS